MSGHLPPHPVLASQLREGDLLRENGRTWAVLCVNHLPHATIALLEEGGGIRLASYAPQDQLAALPKETSE